LEKHQIVPIGGKKGTEFGTKNEERRLSSIEECGGISGGWALVEREWDWWGQEGWIGMVRLGGDKWEGLCTKWVILNEGGWRGSGAGTRELGR